MLTNASGEATATFSYTPYGTLEASTGTATTPLGFAGEYTDPETGLQYLRARFYDPTTGQFMTRDPLAPLTRSPYGYANENPLRYVDPSGLGILPVTFPVVPTEDVVWIYEHPDQALDYAAAGTSILGSITCAAQPELCPVALPAGFALSALLGTAANAIRSSENECSSFRDAEIETLVVGVAALLPGGTFTAATGKMTTEAGLSANATRALGALFDAPGKFLELVHLSAHSQSPSTQGNPSCDC
jgi:RHS repeat-associated protein